MKFEQFAIAYLDVISLKFAAEFYHLKLSPKFGDRRLPVFSFAFIMRYFPIVSEICNWLEALNGDDFAFVHTETMLSIFFEVKCGWASSKLKMSKKWKLKMNKVKNVGCGPSLNSTSDLSEIFF